MATIIETSYFGNFKVADEPKVLLIPTPYEYTTSYCKGTKNGPQAILNASTRLEKFEEELWVDVSTIGINTSNIVTCEFTNNKSKQPFYELEQTIRSTIINGCLPVVIGGEQSLSYGVIKPLYDLYPDVSVLHFSARPCVHETYQNNKFNHTCTVRRVLESMPELKIIQVGIRTVSADEASWLENSSPKIEMFFARDKNGWNLADILSNLSKNVYISFNFNVLDSSIMPSTVLPEPGGLSFEQATNILKNVCAFKEIVGMDFVEFSPIETLPAPDFLASKLIYKTIGYTFARELGAFSEEEKGTLEKV